jgi:soluble lytic murein transglycosylase
VGSYQKTGGKRFEHALRWGVPLLMLLLSACSSVDAQQKNKNAAGPVLLAAAGASASMPTVAAQIAPAVAVPTLPAVLAAREAFSRKQWSVLGLLVPQTASDALAMYPRFWLLRYELWNLPGAQRPVAELQRFIDQNPDAYLADKLRSEWILASMRSGDFATVARLGEPRQTSPQVECARLDAQHMLGHRATAKQALAVFVPGTPCWSLLDQLVADQVLGWNELQPLWRDAIESTKYADARRYFAYVVGPDRMKAFDAAARDPMRWLVAQPKPARDREQQELVTLALGRLARKDRDVGDSYVQREWDGQLPKENLAWVRSQFALIAALNLDDRANQWYRQAGSIRMSEYNLSWKIRAALRQPKIDWKWLVDSIGGMPESQQAEPVWIYWRGRGLANLGRASAANAAFTRIAGQYNFYGQLATEELGNRITVPTRPAALSSSEIADAQHNAGLCRSVALFRLGWRTEAVAEWNFALHGMTDRELLAAADLARREEIYDRVVNTSDRTEREVDFTQRYIAPFENRVAAKTQLISLDTAWVYGLIRQESRFIIDAHSSVGASGLMQLMPSTAKWVAKKIGMDSYHPGTVTDFDTNTVLGTNYLNMVLQKLDGSQVLASAGYNAGPGRSMLWRAALSHPVEGAIFAETIPFTETRLYVKNVMSNATYYAALFTGQPQSLKARLGRIDPQPPVPTNLP